jgi:Flp pilus assembly protein TadG
MTPTDSTPRADVAAFIEMTSGAGATVPGVLRRHDDRVPSQRRPSRPRRQRLHARRSQIAAAHDRGSVALIMVILSVALFAMAGLVIDGGAALAARGRASDLADQASRAGVSALVPASLRGTSPAEITVDPTAAQRAARDVLEAGGAGGEISVGADTVSVTAHITRRSVVLSAFGVTTLDGSATATATLVYGTTTGVPVGAAP